MTFIAVFRAEHSSLATNQAWLSPADWAACDSARELLIGLEQISQTRGTALAQATVQARAEGHAEGFAEGLAQGREQALQREPAQLWQAWEQAAGSAQADMQALREALAQLSLQVVQHITDGLAPADVLAALARRASQALLPPRAAVVRVHPQWADAVRAQLQSHSPGAALEVRADAALRWHDCELDSPAGQLLAGVQAQLGRVGAALQGTAR